MRKKLPFGRKNEERLEEQCLFIDVFNGWRDKMQQLGFLMYFKLTEHTIVIGGIF